MVKVCIDKYKEVSKANDTAGFYMDGTLKKQLDIMLKNVKHDWDFTIIISGGGMVRVGKSVLALQIAEYWTSEINKLFKKNLNFNIKDNIVFNGGDLIEKGNHLGKNKPMSALVFDEAGADLEGRKSMLTSTRQVIDFFRECGQYNLLNILVIPEFFDLPKGIAVSRSIFLLDVYFDTSSEGIFQRGRFKFYSQRNKKHLYLKGKRELNYNAQPYNFVGRFTNFYPVNEQDYRKEKQFALQKRGELYKHNALKVRDVFIYILKTENNFSYRELQEYITKQTGVYLSKGTLELSMAKGKKVNEEMKRMYSNREV